MKTLVKISLLSIISLFLTASLSFAQEAGNEVATAANTTMQNEEMATEAEMYFASGTVAEASGAQIVISEYDFDAGQETKVAYQVNAQTQFEGVASAVDIKAGDDIEIEYQLAGDQKIATRIEKYTPEADEEVQPTPGQDTTQTNDEMNAETQQQLNEEGTAIETNN